MKLDIFALDMKWSSGGEQDSCKPNRSLEISNSFQKDSARKFQFSLTERFVFPGTLQQNGPSLLV